MRPRALLGVALVFTACTAGTPAPGPGSPTGQGGRAEVGVGYRHSIFTHCGVLATEFDGREWVADPQLTDGQGNPPPGWDNPRQDGVMVLLDRDRAEFTTPSGRTARFRVRVAGDPPVPACD